MLYYSGVCMMFLNNGKAIKQIHKKKRRSVFNSYPEGENSPTWDFLMTKELEAGLVETRAERV